jgi:predicted signal transduction protein with EAL and GGDEF domain
MGHPVGDEVLGIIAQRIVQAARGTDFAVRRTDAPAEVDEHTIGRVGGDEFMVVLPAIRKPDDAATVAHRIIEECSQPLSVRGKTVYLGASVGIAIFPNDGQDVVSLVKNADAALYDSKRRGKGNHQFYSAHMNEQAAERLWMETALRAAHENRELVPYFQPQIDVVNQRVVGAEALMRWQHPVRGLIGPDKFIPLAEESGFIAVIGRAMQREVCLQASAWSTSATVVTAIISLARSVGIEVVAEGVETEDQVAFLRERGCRIVQGYLFARPMRAAKIGEWLRSFSSRLTREARG